MKQFNNNLINKIFSSREIRLFISSLIAFAFFFTSCEKDLLKPDVIKVDSKSASQNAAFIGKFEAEQALLSGAVIGNTQPGYTGTGYADYVNSSGDYTEFTVTTTAASSFLLQFRYANGATTNRPLQLKVNGTTIVASLAFPSSGGWTTWTISSATANLVAGTNKIRLTSIGSNGPNLDNLVVETNVTQTGAQEAEQAVLSGPVIAKIQPGFTGTGYADFVNATGDFVEWNINASAVGSYSFKFRYANGGTTNRPLKLEVNGTTVVPRLAFNPTGSWATWSVSSATVNLVAGVNIVRLTSAGSNGPNIDNINYSTGNIKHILYLVDNGFNKLIYLNQKDPAKNWTMAIPKGSRDLQLVSNNKILVSHGNGAAEYDRTTGAKGWSISTYSGVSTAQRLANGNTLLGWSTAASGSTPARVMLSEVNNAGTEVSRVTVQNITTFRLARRLINGNTLITGDINNDLQFKVFEVNSTGAIIWQQLLYGGKGYVANRLANGETQATMGPVGDLYQPGKDDNKVLQLSPTGSILKFWGGMANHPNARLRKFSGYSVVPGSGNILVANWLGDGNFGTGPHTVEFDANNNLVWSWEDHQAAQTITNVLVVE